MAKEILLRKIMNETECMSEHGLERLLKEAQSIASGERYAKRMEQKAYESNHRMAVKVKKKVVSADGAITQVEVTRFEHTDNPMAKVWTKIL